MNKGSSKTGAESRRRSNRRATSPEPDDGDAAAPSAPSSARRSGRAASTPAATPAPGPENETTAAAVKPAPARGRRPTATSTAGGSQPATTAGQKTKTTAENKNTRGSRGGRRRASISLQEPSDNDSMDDDGGSAEEDDTLGGGARSSYEEMEEVSEEEIIDDTVYSVPAQAAVPPFSLLPVGNSAFKVAVPASTVGVLAGAYALLRSFSWQLRLSPFSFEDLCAAVCSAQPSLLLEEVHVCVLRTLAFDELAEERQERKLDLTFLDHVTWPSYVWEWLRLTDDPLAKHEWVQRLATTTTSQSEERAALGIVEHALVVEEREEGAPAAAVAAVAAASVFRQQQGDGGAESSLLGGATAAAAAGVPMEIDEQQQQHQAVLSSPPAAAAAAAATVPTATVTTPLPTPSRRRAFEPVDLAEMDQQLTTEAQHVASTDIFASKGPTPPRQQMEYHTLSAEIKAIILSRLCDHLLDCTTIRAEIDRREEDGEFVTGKGGEGSAFAIMTAEDKRKAAARAARNKKDDFYTDTCVLCGIGGSLLCCDGCPAAYHIRCLGETKASVDVTVWHCPECAVGGRGETAGLRIPVGVRDKWKQPMHIINGTVFRTQLPDVKSRGHHAEELTPHETAAAVFLGESAREQVSNGHRVRSADEIPLPSTFEALESPEDDDIADVDDGDGGNDGDGDGPTPTPAPPTTTAIASFGPDGYVNRYKYGWIAYAAALRAAIDESKKKKKGKSTLGIPTGTCGRLILPEMPEPMPVSKFEWAQKTGRPAGRTTVRCGKCHTCLRPSLREACLNPINRGRDDNSIAALMLPDTSKMSVLNAYVCKVEREFWALMEGPWASEPGGGMQYRAQWAASVRSALVATDLAQILLQLESMLRPTAFTKSWFGEGDGGVGGGGGISRVGSQSEVPEEDDGEEGSSQGGGGGGRQQQRGPDPYDIRFERLVHAGWEMDKRHHSARVAAVNRLPHALLKKAARHAGRKPISGIKYRKKAWTMTSPRLQWIAEMEAVQTCSHLGLAIRKLDAALNWETVVKPKHMSSSDVKFSNASILEKRAAADSSGYEYLVEMKLSPAEEAALQQQQLAAAMMQQRMAMSHVRALAAQAQMNAPTLAPLAPGRLGSLNQWPAVVPGGGGGLSASYAGGGGGAPMLQHHHQQQQLQHQQLQLMLQQQQQQPFMMQQQPGFGLPPRPPPFKLPPTAATVPFTTTSPADGVGQQFGIGAIGPQGVPQQQQQQQQTTTVPLTTTEVIDNGSITAVAPVVQPPIAQTTMMMVPASFPSPAPTMPAAAAAAPSMFGANNNSQSMLPMVYGGPVPMQFDHMSFSPPPPVPVAPAPIPIAQTTTIAAMPMKKESTQEESEEENIGRQIVKAAIQKVLDKEEEERLLHMPAAMAAKMRRRQTDGGSSSTGDLKTMEKDAKDAVAPAATSVPAQYLPQMMQHAQFGMSPTMMPFFGSMGFLPGGAQFPVAPPPPTWTHERDIPLWFIRAYEELCRREAANLSARELQAASRRGSFVNVALKDAARRAAQAAAQAAADACGICTAAQGDSPDLDALWICCDTCNRWFHGGCVAMAQEDVDTIGETDRWDCPGCANARRKAERAARREGKSAAAAAGDPISGGGGGSGGGFGSPFSPMDGGGDGLKKGGRPAKPFYERADYKAGEARMLEKLKRGDTSDYGSGRGKKRKVAETEEEIEQRRAARAARLLKKKEEEARNAAEPAPPVNCPVCQYPDYGRALVECDSCHRWFHYECIGTAVEEVETAVANKRHLHCAECQGKRARPPTQAAVDAAIIAAAKNEDDSEAEDDYGNDDADDDDGDDDDDDDDGHVAGGGDVAPRSSRKRMRVAPPPFSYSSAATSGGGAGAPLRKLHTEATWRDAANRILTKTMRFPDAEPFVEPVDVEEVPDYPQVVSNPMDLGTLQHHVLPRLSSPIDLLTGINLIVNNCVAYNGEDSEYSEAARDMQRGFLRLWRAEGLPVSKEQWHGMLMEASRSEAAGGGRGSGGGGRSGGGRGRGRGGRGGGRGGGIAASLNALAAPPGAVPATDWTLRASRAVVQLSRLPVAEHFLEPVPRGFMNYHDVIKKPMDLGTVAKRLTKGYYLYPADLAVDVAQVWANCRIFNEPDAPVVIDATAAEAAFLNYWNAAGVYQGGTSFGGGGGGGTSGAAVKSGDWREAARIVLYRLINFAPQASWFSAPVSPEEVPDYHDVIAHPMDLGTAMERVKHGFYASPNELLADIDLIWANAEQYNGPDHTVTKAAMKMKAIFEKQWTSSGLPLSVNLSFVGGGRSAAAAGGGSMPVPRQQPMPKQQQQQVVAPFGLGLGLGNNGGSALNSNQQQDDLWASRVRHVLTSIMHHPSAALFNEPLSDATFPGYSQMVLQPMDFGTILKNLGRGRYGGPAQVLADVNLIFENSRAMIAFNQQQQHPGKTMGEELEGVVRQAWQNAGL